jgi:hypothetical protein
METRAAEVRSHPPLETVLQRQALNGQCIQQNSYGTVPIVSPEDFSGHTPIEDHLPSPSQDSSYASRSDRVTSLAVIRRVAVLLSV